MTANAQHSCESVSWYTPSPIVEMERAVLGSIDFDPASDEEANKVVRASLYLSQRGLEWESWPLFQRIHLNPPGGKVDGDSQAFLFWRALMLYRAAGRLDHAIFVAFSLEALQNTQRKEVPAIMHFPFCVPDKRIRFVFPGLAKKSPTHANAIVYVPGRVDNTATFLRVFAALGECKP